MTMEIFIKLLFGISVFTSLGTEAAKKLLDGMKKTYSSNILACIVSVIVGAVVCAGYVFSSGNEPAINDYFTFGVLIMFSWVMAMVGYDKVMQAITQVLRK